MTLEEIRILARDEEDAEGDTARNCMGGAEKQELAALLVRAVEALEASRKGHDHRTISTKCPACLGADQARSLLRELGVEA